MSQLKFPTPEIFEDRLSSYFDDCEKRGRHPSHVGMCGHLGITQRGLTKVYSHREGYKEIYALAKQRIETETVERMLSGKSPVAAAIFVLTQNFHGWTNHHRRETTGKDGGPVEHVQAQPIPADVQNELDAHKQELAGGEDA